MSALDKETTGEEGQGQGRQEVLTSVVCDLAGYYYDECTGWELADSRLMWLAGVTD